MRGKSKFERIYEDLRGKIQSGCLKEGESLPPEIPLAKQYGVAVLTLRRALARLREEGMIISRPYHGTRVSQPSAAASRGNKSKTIGIFASAGINAMTHPVFSRIVNGMEGVLTSAGYSLDVAYCDPDNPDYDARLQQKLRESSTAGWLIPTHLSPPVRKILRKLALPTVLMNFPDETLTGHVFEVDFAAMAHDVLNHFDQQGHRNIWLITPASMAIWSEAIERYAVTSGARCKVRTFAVKAYTLRAGQAAIEQLLSSGEPLDAVFCVDDEIAVGAMQALQMAGKSAPEIAVIGGGDFPIGSLVTPQLSSISYPYYSIGRDAGRLLIDLVEGEDVEPAHRIFQPKLIVRGSSEKAATSSHARSQSKS